jgi:prepilin-type processing-associated H-X9-DG protein
MTNRDDIVTGDEVDFDEVDFVTDTTLFVTDVMTATRWHSHMMLMSGGHMMLMSGGHMMLMSGHMMLMSGGHMMLMSGHMMLMSGHMMLMSGGHMMLMSGGHRRRSNMAFWDGNEGCGEWGVSILLGLVLV